MGYILSQFANPNFEMNTNYKNDIIKQENKLQSK